MLHSHTLFLSSWESHAVRALFRGAVKDFLTASILRTLKVYWSSVKYRAVKSCASGLNWEITRPTHIFHSWTACSACQPSSRLQSYLRWHLNHRVTPTDSTAETNLLVTSALYNQHGWRFPWLSRSRVSYICWSNKDSLYLSWPQTGTGSPSCPQLLSVLCVLAQTFQLKTTPQIP